MSYGTELHQLYKLPFLIEHYWKHKNDNHYISFLDYLKIHYATGVMHDEEDAKLPFKSGCHTTSITISTEAPKTYFSILSKEIFCLKDDYILKDVRYIASECTSSIWQPPKNC
ncbi:MAG: hypothetical protein RJA25_1453 [Bacteroidota bacterium]|jgi:hypothetical protein